MKYYKTFVINEDTYSMINVSSNQKFIIYFISTIIDLLKKGIVIYKLQIDDRDVDEKIWETIDAFYTLGYPYDIDEAFDVVFNPSSSHAIFVNNQVEVIRDLLQRDAKMTVNSVLAKVTISLQNMNYTNPDAKELVTDIYLIYNKLQLKHL